MIDGTNPDLDDYRKPADDDSARLEIERIRDAREKRRLERRAAIYAAIFSELNGNYWICFPAMVLVASFTIGCVALMACAFQRVCMFVLGPYAPHQ